MHLRAYASAALLTSAAVLSCSSGSKSPGPNLDVSFDTGTRVVQPGDTFECFYTNVTAKTDLAVNGATASQGPGGHHVSVYYTDQSMPAGHHACIDAEMLTWHQLAVANGNKEGVLDLPAGYATRVPAGKQIVVQSHYVNATGQPQTVDDTVTLKVLDPSKVTEYANSFVVSDTTFSIAPRAQTTSVTECTVPQDFRVILLIGHMHEMGVHYRLEQLDDSGGVKGTLYDTDWQPAYVSHPPVSHYDPGAPLTFAANTKLRQTCVWNNSSDQTAAFPTEMCVAFTYYIPDSGFIVCKTHAPGASDSTDAGGAQPQGGTATNCVPPGYAGNEKGVGAYCDSTTSCPSSATPLLCTASFGSSPGKSFCTTPCTADADCGSGAYCVAGSGGSGCVPAQCHTQPLDAGTD